MTKMFKAVALGLSLVLSIPAYATPADELGACMVDALDGKERKQLAKWIFFAIASHPEIETFANVTNDDVDHSNMYIGALMTRLMTEDCPSEMKRAHDSDPLALRQAFELVGKVAMQELVTDQSVMKSIVSYAKYADMEKIGSILGGQPGK